MSFPSITTILGVAFLGYSAHSMWMMAQLFSTLKCTDVPCYYTFLTNKPRMQMALFTSTVLKPLATEVERVDIIKDFNYWHDFHKEYLIIIPSRTKRNGTLYMHIVLAEEGQPMEWKTLKRSSGNTLVHTVPITQWIEPIAETFKLLSEGNKFNREDKSVPSIRKPQTHIMSEVHVTMLTDDISLSERDLPPELSNMVQVNQKKQIMPILKTDFFKTRRKDLTLVNKEMETFNINFYYRPIGIGKLRLMLLVEHAMKTMEAAGLPKQEVDELKSLFSDTNLYLLLITIFVASIHMLFDFLSFKNDIAFWRKKKTYEGLSSRTIMWRAFSQIVIFLYLMDEKTSLLVLVPAGVGVLIELWKCKKIHKISFTLSGALKRIENHELVNKSRRGKAEQETEEFDKQGMRYLSYILYPLCAAGAIYSLLYQPHRSWYSWTINSLVNGVYAFGFLFMLPQLFVNYKLKSVAALPWRAFMYKAFNTFIDDFFAFIITMPTAHRVACLRDDVVFLIYLYQRWLYPVDKNRIDLGAQIMDTVEQEVETEGTLAIAKPAKGKKID